MIYFLLSITLVTIIFLLLNRIKILSVCPICAGVVITWAGGIMALYTNQSWADPLIVAILMGASVGALAEKYGNQLGFFWKLVLVLSGFSSIYYIVSKDLIFGLVLGVVAILIVFKAMKQKGPSIKQKDIFENCC